MVAGLCVCDNLFHVYADNAMDHELGMGFNDVHGDRGEFDGHLHMR